MIVTCGIDGKARDASEIFVCHHCGMPVCEKHGWIVAFDDAFADSATAFSILPDPAAPSPAAPRDPAAASTAVAYPAQVQGAIELPSAPQQPGSFTPPPATSVPRAAMTVPTPAMHCHDCVERFHRGAVKRHGWAEPQPATAGFAVPAGRP